MARIKSFLHKFNSKILIILGIVLVAVFSVAASKEFIKKRQLDNEIASLQSEIENLKVEQDEFITLIDNYNSESYIEQEARVNFNYKKKGEKVVVIKTDKKEETINSINNESENLNSPDIEQGDSAENFKLWWNYFFSEGKT